jgi:Protein of unknown function (DUF3562)
MHKFYGNGPAFVGLQHTAGIFEPHESDTMTLFASATHPRGSAAHEGAIEALAREAHVPIAQVTQLYARELAVLTAGARITGFLTILTTRTVRKILRHGRHSVRTPAGVDAPVEDGAERWLSHRTEPVRDRGRAEETSPSAYGYPHRTEGGR